MTDGILLIDKPIGWTSFDVVAKARNLISKQAGRKVKVGHSGTLDPLATGLLILLIGSYTKRAQEFLKLDKTYDVTIKLGETSSTADGEGEKTKISDNKPTQKDIEIAVKSFLGEIAQIPPVYSAIKVDGKRAYELARSGKEVNLKPRNVTIYDISNLTYKYPEVSFTAKVSSGTYIRSLALDIGMKLKTGAYLSDLKRTKIGSFKLADATYMDGLQASDNILDRVS